MRSYELVGVEDVNFLKKEIEEHAISRGGEYPLVSGLKTSYYCWVRRLSQRPDIAEIIGEMLAPSIIESGAEGVGGMALGATPLTSAVGVAAKRAGVILPGFSVRPVPKSHGIEEDRQVSASITASGEKLLIKGRRLSVVEDTITTGLSISRVVELVTKLGCLVVQISLVIERHERGADRFREKGIPVERLFYTDESGSLYVDDKIAERYGL